MSIVLAGYCLDNKDKIRMWDMEIVPKSSKTVGILTLAIAVLGIGGLIAVLVAGRAQTAESMQMVVIILGFLSPTITALIALLKSYELAERAIETQANLLKKSEP